MSADAFSLLPAPGGHIEEGPLPSKVELPLCGYGLFKEKGERVAAGEKIATSDARWAGDMHAPVAGTIESLDGERVVIRAEGDQSRRRAQAPDDSNPAALKDSLASLGFDVRCLEAAKTLIVNGLNPEPMAGAASELLASQREKLAGGLKLLQSLISPSTIILAAPKGQADSVGPNPIHHISPVHPNGMDPLVIRAVTGRERPDSVAIIDVASLYFLSEAAYGMPLTDTLMSVAGHNFRVRVGTPLGELLEHAGVTARAGDQVILGGPMLGRAQYSLRAPVGKGDYAAVVIPEKLAPGYGDSPCLNCGECTLICPARITVSLMARYAEFGFFDKALEYDIDSCIECGLCAWRCPARRPLLQYIRLGKAELAAREEQGVRG